MNHGLSKENIELVRDILSLYVPHCEVWVFGSRARGKYKKFSDLDLAIQSPTPLEPGTIPKLSEAFTASDLPVRVDIIDFATIEDKFRQIIEQEKVPLFE